MSPKYDSGGCYCHQFYLTFCFQKSVVTFANHRLKYEIVIVLAFTFFNKCFMAV